MYLLHFLLEVEGLCEVATFDIGLHLFFTHTQNMTSHGVVDRILIVSMSEAICIWSVLVSDDLAVYPWKYQGDIEVFNNNSVT